MSAALDIKTRLDALGSLPQITIGHMPDLGDTAVGTIYEYSGAAAERGFGVVGVKYEHPAVQIVFRGAPEDYASPRAHAEIAFRNLAEVQATTLSGTEYLQIDPQQTPFKIKPKDDNKRFYIGFNAYIHKGVL